MKYYYILTHLPSEHQDMLDGQRIVELDTNKISLQEKVGEGPYESLLQLKKESKIYRQLLLVNPKRAQKIACDQFLIQVKNIIFWPDGVDDSFQKMIYRIMQHSANGTINRKGVSGVHLYNKNKIKILRIINEDKATGIFEAEIEVFNENTGMYVKKVGSSSFFPKDWGLQQLIFECYEAYKNRKEVESQIYHGRTASGILLEFIYKQEDKFATVYPILEN
jgi:hypothetical protein